MISTDKVLPILLNSTDPSIRFLIHTQLLGESALLPQNRLIQKEVRSSERACLMLQGSQGKHPYQKWKGSHWVLSLLADIGYPAGEQGLVPLREAEYRWLKSENHQKHIRLIQGLYRRCASQEGNAVYSIVKLGLADEGVDQLVQSLLRWQWPDGGWNCDKDPGAHVSSYHESLIPLRALIAYNKVKKDEKIQSAIERAAENFLKRHLFKTIHGNEVINPAFTKLHYPHFWHYDFLGCLVVLDEGGYLSDPRCGEALDLLESKQLPDQGFPAEEKFWRKSETEISGTSYVEWGSSSINKRNDYVTIEAIKVLKHAGRVR